MTQELRREAREAVASPGRFEGEAPMAYVVWQASLDGVDDECGSVSIFDNWFGLLGRWIVNQSEWGHIAVERFDTREAARRYFDELAAEYDLEEALAEYE